MPKFSNYVKIIEGAILETIDFIYGLASGLLSGVIVGWIVEHYRLKNSLKVERIKRLTPYIEMVHPIIEELCDDISYFKKTQFRKMNEENQNFVIRISKAFDKYGLWYEQFQSNGFKPELGATSKLLLYSINGLFAHSQMSKKYGEDHILREIDEIFDSLNQCRVLVEQFLTN